MSSLNDRWAVERVMRGDGRVLNGIWQNADEYYASSEGRGGREHFWQIDINSLVLNNPYVRSLEELKRWCTENRGKALRIGGPGARDKIENIKQYYRRSEGKTRISSRDGNCVHSSLVNAVWRLCGEGLAIRALQHPQLNMQHFPSLKSATKCVQDMRLGVELRRVPKGEKESFTRDRFGWVLKQKDGVMLVRVEQKGLVDHCVVVDSSARLIVDSCEEYPFELNVDTLHLCGGSEASNLRIAEVSFLVRQRGKSCDMKPKCDKKFVS